MKISRNW